MKFSYYPFRRLSDGRNARILSEVQASTGPQIVVDIEGEGPSMMPNHQFTAAFVATEDYKDPEK